jgi:hypothetical protein
MAALAMKPKRLPLITIVGATGTGKSQVRYLNHQGVFYLIIRVACCGNSKSIQWRNHQRRRNAVV